MRFAQTGLQPVRQLSGDWVHPGAQEKGLEIRDYGIMDYGIID